MGPSARRLPREESTCLISGADGFQVPLITDVDRRKRRDKARQRRTLLRQKGHELRPLPPRPKDADQRRKEAKLVTFYDPSGRHQHTAATAGDCRAADRLMRHQTTQSHLDRFGSDRIPVQRSDGPAQGPWSSLACPSHRCPSGRQLPLRQHRAVGRLLAQHLHALKPAQTPDTRHSDTTPSSFGFRDAYRIL